MSKKKGIIRLVVLLAVIAFVVYTAVSGLGSDRSGSLNDISLGLDLRGGVSITYEAVGDVNSQDMSDTKAKLEKRVQDYSTEAQVYFEGSDRITVDIPGATDANAVLQELGKPRSNATTNAREYVVNLTLTSDGVEAFSKATEELAPTKGRIYIMYNGEVLSAPTVNEHIASDTCSITGMGDLEAAQTLASNIRIGALPVQLQEMRSQVVGAKLGQDAVRTSLMAGVIGLILVFAFMIIYYRIANCIIFARIREEIGAGKSVRTAIDAGFAKAFSAIIDGNVTTLIAAGVLYFIGSGTVKGFAQTLALGIVVSMFTALVITKNILKSFYAVGLQDEKLYGKTVYTKTFNFIGKRKLFYSASGIVIAIGIVAMVVSGVKGHIFNYSLDFIGGASTSVTFNENYSVEKLESDVQPVVSEVTGDNDIQMTPVTGSNEVIIKTRTLTVDERDALYSKLSETFGVDESTIQTENISAAVSGEMKRSAILSVIIAAIFMLIYVWIRFKEFSFGVSSVLPLLHDVFVLLAFYAVLRWTVGNTFIACMLTLVGYSINATIVVFDRIRENLHTNKNLAEVVNVSVTQTLSRSINTSLTTLIMVVVLYILGVTSIKEFALPLIVGVICGCYSSVCIAGCLWYDLKNALDKRKAKKTSK